MQGVSAKPRPADSFSANVFIHRPMPRTVESSRMREPSAYFSSSEAQAGSRTDFLRECDSHRTAITAAHSSVGIRDGWAQHCLKAADGVGSLLGFGKRGLIRAVTVNTYVSFMAAWWEKPEVSTLHRVARNAHCMHTQLHTAPCQQNNAQARPFPENSSALRRTHWCFFHIDPKATLRSLGAQD